MPELHPQPPIHRRLLACAGIDPAFIPDWATIVQRAIAHFDAERLAAYSRDPDHVLLSPGRLSLNEKLEFILMVKADETLQLAIVAIDAAAGPGAVWQVLYDHLLIHPRRAELKQQARDAQQAMSTPGLRRF